MQIRLPFRSLAALAVMGTFFSVVQAQQGGGAQQGRAGRAGGQQPPGRDAQVQQQPTGTAMILGQVVTGDPQPAQPRAGGQQQLVVAQQLPVGQGELVRGRVQAGGPPAEQQGDGPLGVPLGGVQEDVRAGVGPAR